MEGIQRGSFSNVVRRLGWKDTWVRRPFDCIISQRQGHGRQGRVSPAGKVKGDYV